MNYRKILIHISLAASIAAPAFLSAETRYEQKLILVQGTESRFMKGESSPVFNFKRDGVLPYLLARGWTIVSVHVNAKSRETNPYGYVVVQREITSNQPP